ncbi:armadillo repeat-containing protein 1 [Holotrichia oblita]|uniref:Armadillo repeat-containing protein 1 n=1 Tax=Holotrichia oblita TaxID=644536 RepID=A0ACB9TXN5_HOLOL|nr:armadillo repeat-containing protein 1 [Holotrichia oblita]
MKYQTKDMNVNKVLTNDSNAATTLKKYKKLTGNIKNHSSLIKDKTVILCAAMFLDSSERNIIRLCLDIIEDFVQNDSCHYALITTFGIFESLESLSIRLRGDDEAQANRAAVMVDILRKSTPPAYSTRLRVKGKQARKTTTMYQLYIPQLTNENRQELEEALVQIKGVVSFVIDLDRQRCTVRVTPNLTVESLVRMLSERYVRKILIVSKSPEDVCEAYVDVLNKNNKSLCADYFPEEESPPKGKSVSHFTNITKNANGWIKSAANFWNKSFYW